MVEDIVGMESESQRDGEEGGGIVVVEVGQAVALGFVGSIVVDRVGQGWDRAGDARWRALASERVRRIRWYRPGRHRQKGQSLRAEVDVEHVVACVGVAALVIGVGTAVRIDCEQVVRLGVLLAIAPTKPSATGCPTSKIGRAHV